MTALHLKATAGSDGKLHLGEMDVGCPGADVEITVSVTGKFNEKQWKQEMRELLDSLGEVHVEAYPRFSMREPWREE